MARSFTIRKMIKNEIQVISTLGSMICESIRTDSPLPLVISASIDNAIASTKELGQSICIAYGKRPSEKIRAYPGIADSTTIDMCYTYIKDAMMKSIDLSLIDFEPDAEIEIGLMLVNTILSYLEAISSGLEIFFSKKHNENCSKNDQ